MNMFECKEWLKILTGNYKISRILHVHIRIGFKLLAVHVISLLKVNFIDKTYYD